MAQKFQTLSLMYCTSDLMLDSSCDFSCCFAVGVDTAATVAASSTTVVNDKHCIKKLYLHLVKHIGCMLDGNQSPSQAMLTKATCAVPRKECHQQPIPVLVRSRNTGR